jgi:hypothetical protein
MDTLAAAAPSPAPVRDADRGDAYVPGVCNIGPYEIARRRRSGLVGIGVAIVVAVILLAVAAPQPLRAIVLLPLWGGFTTYLQAVHRFCIGFAVAGLENFGPDAAARRRVVDEDARAADRRAVRRLILEGLLLAAPLTAAFVLLPI